jgi:predicted esterase
VNVREVYPDHHFRLPPRRRGSVDALVILLHGVGSSAHAMKPAADEISLGLGHAAVVTLNGIEPFDLRRSGFQWFSVAGVTDANRARRVAEALPRVEAIESECARANVSRERTAVVGFSQGAIMALHLAASLQRPPTAIVSWAGRIAPPQQVLGRLSPATKIPFPAAALGARNSLLSCSRAVPARALIPHGHWRLARTHHAPGLDRIPLSYDLNSIPSNERALVEARRGLLKDGNPERRCVSKATIWLAMFPELREHL